MRKVIILTMMVMLLLASSTMAKSSMFVGGQYDNDDGWSATHGTAFNLIGPIWSITRLTVGSNDMIEIDFAAMKTLGSFSIGVVAGPNAEWVGEGDIVTYLVGGAGGLIGWTHNPLGIGVVAGGKYKFALEGDTYYRDGWQTGLWLTKAF